MTARYFNALGPARETRPGIHVAIAWSYIENVNATLLDELEHPGSTAIIVGCDGGHQEVWLADVR